MADITSPIADTQKPKAVFESVKEAVRQAQVSLNRDILTHGGAVCMVPAWVLRVLVGCGQHQQEPATAPLLTDNQLREQMPDKVRCAVEFFHDDRNSYGSVTAMWGHGQACTLHLYDLTRRLAEAEAENGRFAEMLESSVSDWRKLYTEERAERVRIQGILLNDVQAEHQESDEHIKGLDAVIKTQDKTIRDLKSRVAEAEAERDALRERNGKLARILKHSQDVFDAIDMTGLCPLCQGDEDHNSGCPMRAVEEDIQAALAATEVPHA